MENNHIYNPISLVSDMWGSNIGNILQEIANSSQILGYELFIVGGTVRDLILGKNIKDLDISVNGNAITLAKTINDTLGIPAKYHERFLTATLFLNNLEIDLVSARSETYPKPGSLPSITLSNIDEDLKRRDFSINALAIPLNSPHQIIDPTGGIDDIYSESIRVLHSKSFIDDPTRIFRLIKYAARFDFGIEDSTLLFLEEAISNNVINTISKDRLTHELNLIFTEVDIEKCINMLLEYRVLGLKSSLKPRELNLNLNDLHTAWASFLLVFDMSDYQSFTSLFKFDKSLLNTLNEVIELERAKPNLLVSNVHCKTIVPIYRILKNISRESIVIYRNTCNNQALSDNLDKYLLYTDNTVLDLMPSDLINLGVPKNHISFFLELLTESKLSCSVLTKQDEIDLVVQYMNE